MPSLDDFSEIKKDKKETAYKDNNFIQPAITFSLIFPDNKLWYGAFPNLHKEVLIKEVYVLQRTQYKGIKKSKDNIKYVIDVCIDTDKGNILEFSPYVGVNKDATNNYKESYEILVNNLNKIEEDYKNRFCSITLELPDKLNDINNLNKIDTEIYLPTYLAYFYFMKRENHPIEELNKLVNCLLNKRNLTFDINVKQNVTSKLNFLENKEIIQLNKSDFSFTKYALDAKIKSFGHRDFANGPFLHNPKYDINS